MTQSSRSKRVTEGMHVVIKNQWRSARVNFINILRSAFCAKVCIEEEAFLYLKFVFVTFGQPEIVEKAVGEIDYNHEENNYRRRRLQLEESISFL